MSLIISTGSNIGDRELYLKESLRELKKIFHLLESSQIYESPAVDYLNQPDFLNQVHSFELPSLSPQQAIEATLALETKMGRTRERAKGPRTIDIDFLFWGLKEFNFENLIIPHPRLFERSFIVLPLKELKAFKLLSQHYIFPTHFANEAKVFKSTK